jgi:hypothetical protein
MLAARVTRALKRQEEPTKFFVLVQKKEGGKIPPSLLGYLITRKKFLTSFVRLPFALRQTS